MLAHLRHIHTSPSIAVTDSIDKRWKKADRDIFILAAVFNPYIRGRAFDPSNELATAGRMWSLVRKAFKQFSNGEEPNAQFRDAFSEYY